jgi:hypothetical protein
VRSFRPVRSPPARGYTPDVVQTRLHYYFRVGTVAARTAPAFGWPLAPRYGSDLLTLRLRSCCSWVMAFCTTAPIEEVSRDLPVPLAPRINVSLARPGDFRRPGPSGGGIGLSPPAGIRLCVLVCAVAAVTLWVTASGLRVETSRLPDWARPRFLFAPRLQAPDSCYWTGHDTVQRSW